MMNTTALLAEAGSENHPTETFEQGMDHFLRQLGYNGVPSALNTLNVQAIIFTLIVVFFGVLLYDWIAYQFAVNNGSISSYSSYGRKLLTTAADAWDQHNLTGLESYLHRNGRAVESLEQMVDILDSLSKAVHKWDQATTKKGRKLKSRVLF